MCFRHEPSGGLSSCASRVVLAVEGAPEQALQGRGEGIAGSAPFYKVLTTPLTDTIQRTNNTTGTINSPKNTADYEPDLQELQHQ